MTRFHKYIIWNDKMKRRRRTNRNIQWEVFIELPSCIVHWKYKGIQRYIGIHGNQIFSERQTRRQPLCIIYIDYTISVIRSAHLNTPNFFSVCYNIYVLYANQIMWQITESSWCKWVPLRLQSMILPRQQRHWSSKENQSYSNLLLLRQNTI